MIAAVAALGMSAVPARAELKPSSPEAIAAAVADCWQAASSTGLDEAGLKAKGWQPGSIKTPDGKPVPANITFLAKHGSDIIMTTSKLVDPRGCIVMARVDSLDSITLAAREIFKQLYSLDSKVEVKQPTPAEVVYFALPKAALLRPSGTKDKPATTIQVSYTSPEKK